MAHSESLWQAWSEAVGVVVARNAQHQRLRVPWRLSSPGLGDTSTAFCCYTDGGEVCFAHEHKRMSLLDVAVRSRREHCHVWCEKWLRFQYTHQGVRHSGGRSAHPCEGVYSAGGWCSERELAGFGHCCSSITAIPSSSPNGFWTRLHGH